MSTNIFRKMVLRVQNALGATAVIFKNDFSQIDNEGNCVAFKIKGFWNCMNRADVIEYATMGGTN